ncbi:MAG: T9SS type A sorting domain-containing protein [Saprospiraceae bacterium]|jgi:polyhydroxybutyrate depolymerase|nr:T9SS type A sorting domain-containing protein [Saprospiraceae bacterium]
MTNKPMVLLFLFIFTSICQLWASPPAGKIRVTTVIDGVTREYFIHVPSSYDGSKNVPLVFMLHGTGGDGEKYYDTYGWKELAEKEGFLAVFPSSGRYKIIDEGEYKTTTKWNTMPDASYVFQPGEVGLDDIKFLRRIVYEMFDNYNIDTKRVYLNGFSNGGQMAAKCSVEMSDLLAAVAQNASSFFIDTTYVPKRKLPVLYQVGNKDYGPGNEGPEASLSLLDSLISTPNIPWLNGKHYRIAHSHIRNFDLQETYTIEGDTNTAVVATYLPNHPGPGTGYEFKFIFVKGLAHIYPNGVNHFFDAPAIHWNWMKQYVLEDDNNTGGQKVRVTTNVDNKEREYYVHIPSSYDGNKEVPLVFMLHGTSGDGETFYNSHGWIELSDQEGFLAVFPSSGKYKIIDDGVNKNISKWNTTPDADWAFQPGETGLDDIKFLRKVVDEMKTNYNIDAKRIYLNGFSNGGQMAAKCAIEMSDILAAVAENTGSFFLDTTYVPKRKLPILYQVGNKDYGPGNEGPEGSLAYLDTLLTTPGILWMNGKHYRVAHNHIRDFDLQETFTIEGDTNTAVIATYLPNHPGPGTGYEFKFIFVKGLAHQYPNGNNHFFDAPRIHWDWMKQYQLEWPDSTASFTLSTQGGHGGGSYAEGKKIHIWSAQQDGKVFTHWTGDVQYLASAKEYHTVVTMPGKNISVQANYAELLPTMKLLQVDVQGAQKVKKLYLHLPSKNEMKGLIWFFHGTDGNAASMASNIEVKQFMDLMMTKKFGIIAITSEESQDGVDYDANGAIQWSYGIDSTLIDYANIRAVRDSLLRRGLLDPKTPHLAYGYSAGAAFSELVVNVLNWKAAIGHTVAGSPQLSLVATKPFFLSINENDRHPGVGPAGNAQARENHINYANRGVCAELHEFSQSPLFPERFDRSLFITEPLSKAIYNEIKENNMLDENSVLKGLFSELQFQVFSNPNKFPIITALNQLQLKDLEDQISVTNAEHKPKADINGQLVEWLGSLCGTVSVEDVTVADVLKVYPNPSTVGVWLEAEANWALFDLNGRQLLKGHSSYVDVSQLMAGMYILESNNEKVKIIKR